MNRERTNKSAVALRLIFAGSALWSPPALSSAADKNGVSPQTISRPSGPGSLEGLGDAFQPALNTGTAGYSVNINLPSGVAGLTSALTLRYDSGDGFGPLGIGWSFGPKGIRRQVDKGLPRYVDPPGDGTPPDRFLGLQGEELVPLSNGYYLAKIEGTHIRYRPIFGDDQVIDHWEAHLPDGTKLEFGLTPTARIADADGLRIFEWKLERQTDVHGNVIQYSYTLPDPTHRQVYLSEIRYGPGAPPWTHFNAATFVYENRTDPFTDYRSGFRVYSAKRLTRIDVTFTNTLIRRYILTYEADPHWSLLSSVTEIGSDQISSLPTTTFGYATFDLADPQTPISATKHVMGSVGEPAQLFDGELTELIDLNADALPDLLYTGTSHRAYLNRGPRQIDGTTFIFWEGPIELAVVEQRTHGFQLSQSNVHLADMNGDTVSDLVVTNSYSVEYFPSTGDTGWGGGQLMSVQVAPPPAPFGADSAHVRMADLDFDKRVDVIRSQGGAYQTWFNQADGTYSPPVWTDAAYHGAQAIDFADPGVHLADMNGDRLLDVVKVTRVGVVSCASKGYGRFAPDILIPFDLQDPGLDLDQIARAKLTDINGDGLSDLVVERFSGDDLRYWINLGNDLFAPSCLITGLPATPGSETRWADINGNGTSDLVYANPALPESRILAVDIGLLVAGSAHFNALTSIDNGYGRHTELRYRSTTDYYLEAWHAGNPWTTKLPFPSSVVSHREVSVGLDLDGHPDEGSNGDVYITDFVYRDGYYDPLEKQFRGFSFVKQIDFGDERFGGDSSPTLVTRHRFHTGAPDGQDNDGDGDIDEVDYWAGREEEPLKGVKLWRETTTLPDDVAEDGGFADPSKVFNRVSTPLEAWEIRNLCTNSGGELPDLLTARVGAVGSGYVTDDFYDREVRQAVSRRVETSVIELGQGTPKQLRTDTNVDPFGNQLYSWRYGDLSDPTDDLYEGTTYVLDANAEANWIVNHPSELVQRDTRGEMDDPFAAGTLFVTKIRNYYDGSPFVGLPQGTLGSAGILNRTEAVVSQGEVPAITERSYVRGDPRAPNSTVDVLRQEFDQYGNIKTVLDANAQLDGGQPDGNGHERCLEYDPLMHTYPVTETIVIGNDSDDLTTNATYDYLWGKPTTLTDFNGHTTTFVWDQFGRFKEEHLPGDPPGEPSYAYVYNLGDPISSITTTAHPNEGNSPDVVTSLYFDGAGRKLGLHEHGDGGIMQAVTLYNTRGQPARVFQPYAGEPTNVEGQWQIPDAGTPSYSTTYDAAGRALSTTTPPDKDGATATSTTRYQPLTVIESDGEDNRVGGTHFGTPKTLVRDGLGRLVEVREVEMLSSADSGTFVTRYRYAQPSLLAEIEDSSGNIKYTRFDGLGRKILINDCDRGQMTYLYDAFGSVLSTVDAKGQEILFAYDGVNRMLTEDYLDSGLPFSLERSPDVIYHYDRPSSDYPYMHNTRGKLAWVEDLTGAEIRGYDIRGELETVVKRVARHDGTMGEWTKTILSDNLGHVYQITYPDGSIVRREYDSRGLLHATPGIIDSITYTPSARQERYQLANGTASQYQYDPWLRLVQLETSSATRTLQNLSYSYDHANNVTGIVDRRPLPSDDPRNQTAGLVMDDSYRLVRATGAGYGTIEYAYDRLGNMVAKTSPDIPDPDVSIGTMSSGGSLGTANRIGRAPGDPPGPHALTSTNDGASERSFEYDANGNLVDRDGDQYVYDFKDRLCGVTAGGQDIHYVYDYTDRRVVKRVGDAETIYVDKLSEIRDGRLVQYVIANDRRVARFEGSIPPPAVVTQRISLVAGWNLVSFQVVPSSTDPEVLLADLADQLAMILGHGQTGFLAFEPDNTDNTLTALLPNHGYWIKMTGPAQLVIEGSVDREPVEIPADELTLVGIPGFQTRASADLAQDNPGIRSVWTYSDERWLNFGANQAPFLNRLGSLPPGSGCWMLCDVPTTLEAPPSTGSAKITYYHADPLGSTNVLTDSLAQLVSEIVYYPFGSPRHKHQPADPPFVSRYGFIGKEHDAETGLHYLEARYLLAEYGRFSRVDPTAAHPPSHWLTSPQRSNAYLYAMANPMTMVDPTGLDGESFIEIPLPGKEFDSYCKKTHKTIDEWGADAYEEGGIWGTAKAAGWALAKGFIPENTADAALNLAGAGLGALKYLGKLKHLKKLRQLQASGVGVPTGTTAVTMAQRLEPLADAGLVGLQAGAKGLYGQMMSDKGVKPGQIVEKAVVGALGSRAGGALGKITGGLVPSGSDNSWNAYVLNGLSGTVGSKAVDIAAKALTKPASTSGFGFSWDMYDADTDQYLGSGQSQP